MDSRSLPLLQSASDISSRNVVGIPAYKDETGDYHLDDAILKLQPVGGLTFLVVDDASNRGQLTRKANEAIEHQGGVAKSAVLIGNSAGLQPDYVGEIHNGKPPKFFWEPTLTVSSDD